MTLRRLAFIIVLTATWSARLYAVEPVHVAYVDMQRLLEIAPQIVAGRERLKTEFGPRYTDIQGDESGLKKLQKRLRTDGDIMTADRRLVLERQIRSLQRQINRSREDVRDEFSYRLDEIVKAVTEQVTDVIREYAQEHGYDLVVSAPILYASKTVDITDQIQQRLRLNFEGEVGESQQ